MICANTRIAGSKPVSHGGNKRVRCLLPPLSQDAIKPCQIVDNRMLRCILPDIISTLCADDTRVSSTYLAIPIIDISPYEDAPIHQDYGVTSGVTTGTPCGVDAAFSEKL